ncbi:MAG: glutamate racemase, partial [Nitrosotalea sp.]
MTKIAVFDSGLGSLSVIKPIQKRIKTEIIYFADQKNYPYGTKTVSNLDKIIKSTISKLQEKFNPDIIIVGSNT